jgi:transcriptional regulator with XRE-family HTH domain
MSILNILGENFKKAREAQGLSVAELASKATLSQNQIEQIENGSNKSFYTAAIKFQSAKKVAKILGLSDEEAFEKKKTNDSQQIPFQFAETAKTELVEDPKTELEEKSQEEAKIVSFSDAEPEKSLKIKKQMSAELEKVSSINTHLEEVIATEQTGDDKARQETASYSKFLIYLGSAIALVFAVAHYNQQSKEANNNRIIAPTPPIQTQEPNQADVIKDNAPVEMAKTTPSEIIAPKEVAKTTAKVITSIAECSGLFSNPEKYTPTIASKIGNQVYVQSKSEASICFEDADGNQQKRDLAQNAGASFYGKAPFKLASNNLDQFDIFYQGYKVKADLSKKAITLMERSVD